MPAISDAYACGMLRASASSSASVCSAAVTTFDCGAFATMIPRLVAASTSTLSTPTPARPIARRFVACSISSAVSFVAERIRMPSYSPIRSRSCSSVQSRPSVDVEVLAQQLDAGVADLLLHEDLRPAPAPAEPAVCAAAVAAASGLLSTALILRSFRLPTRYTWSAPRTSSGSTAGEHSDPQLVAPAACGRARCRRSRSRAASSATAAASTASSKSIVPTTSERLAGSATNGRR